MDLGGGGHFRHMPPLLCQMWACPNRKMNRYVEHAPYFGLEVGVVVRKRNEIRVCVKKGMFAYDLGWKCSENEKIVARNTNFFA